MPHFFRKIKDGFPPEGYIVTIVILVGFGSFGLGRLSVETTTTVPVEILMPQESVAALSAVSDTPLGGAGAGGLLIASRNGSKYHYPWCSGGKRISEKNKLWFASAREARAAGYEPAANCKGLQ